MDRSKITKRLIFWYGILWLLLIVALYLAFGVYFVDTTSTKSKWVGLFAGSIAILLATCKMLEMSFYKSVNPLFKKITKYFINGSKIFVFRIFKISFIFMLLISWFLIYKIGISYAITFICGCVFSFLVVYVASLVSSRITTRSSQFYNESMAFALKQFFNSGTVISCVAVSFSIIPIVILYHIYKDYQIINGFLLGATFIALVNNISSVVAKQAYNCASDVAGEIIPQFENNDRRNPLLLLGGISRGILNVNVLASDLFTLFSIALISAMTIGGEFLQLMGAFLPIIIMGCGIFSSVVVNLLTVIKKVKNPTQILFVSMFFTNLLFCIGTYYLINEWLPAVIELTIPVCIGALGGFLSCFLYARYVNEYHKPAINVANSVVNGFEQMFRQTIKEGFGCVFVFAFILAFCIIVSFLSAGGMEEPSLGVYGVMLCVLGMLATSIVTIGSCAFGFIVKNVDVVLDSYEEDICEKQNIVANSLSDSGVKIVSLFKAFVNCATIFVSIASLVAYSLLVDLEEVDILNPFVMGALFIGAATPFLFCSSIMGIVSKAARRLVFEFKTQIRTYSQILRYEIRPNYEKCVDLCAISSCVQVIISSAIVVLIFVFVVAKLNTEALLGYVFGVILSSFGLIFLTSATSIIGKSARRYYQKEFNCSQNQVELNATSINESIFVSIKDIVASSLNVLIKFLAVLALSIVPLFVI